MRTDIVIAAAVLIAGIAAGAAYRHAHFGLGTTEFFGQREFGAAVALACGRGFADPGPAAPAAVDDFLHVRRDDLTCADLPAGAQLKPPDTTQGMYRYLMATTAVMWRISGLSWSRLTPLYGLLYGLTLAIAYGLFRLLVGRIAAVIATLALLVSPSHLQSLPQLRDYAKAPFILALILIMGWIARPPFLPRRAIVLAIAFGVTLGLGFGFRNDLLIAVLPWAAVVLCGTPGPVRSRVGLKLACLAVSATLFVATAWPILTAYTRGSNSGHVLLLGLMLPFNGPLGIDSSIYSWGYSYADEFATTLISGVVHRVSGHGVTLMSAEYDRAMLAYVMQIVRHWPADMATRAFASAIKVIQFPFVPDAYVHPVPDGLTNAGLRLFFQVERALLLPLKNVALFGAGAALAIVGATSVRAGVLLLLLLLYFAGYPALQFDLRHFFHLEFIAWAALAFVAERLVMAGIAAWRSRHDLVRDDTWHRVRIAARQPLRNLMFFAAVALIVMVGPVAGLRAYQSNRLGATFSDEYLAARREPVRIVSSSIPGNRTALATPALWASRVPGQGEAVEYLVVELSPDACDALYVPLTFAYRGPDHEVFDHSVNALIVDGHEPTLVFAPVYFSGTDTAFSRIELPAENAACLTRVSRILPPDTPNVLLDAVFTPHWREQTLFQTVHDVESQSGPERMPNLQVIPPSAPGMPRRGLRTFDLPDHGSDAISSIVKSEPGGAFLIKGRPASPESYAMVIKDQTLPAGARVICRGVVRRGGVTVGVQFRDRWVKSVNVGEPGPFAVSLTLDEAAAYSVVVANFVASGDNDVAISALGWVP